MIERIAKYLLLAVVFGSIYSFRRLLFRAVNGEEFEESNRRFKSISDHINYDEILTESLELSNVTYVPFGQLHALVHPSNPNSGDKRDLKLTLSLIEKLIIDHAAHGFIGDDKTPVVAPTKLAAYKHVKSMVLSEPYESYHEGLYFTRNENAWKV